MRANTRHPRGIVSLLALILMATVTATSVGSAAIILNELRQTESLDQAIAAVYAAEAGVEDGLYLVKNRRQTQTLSGTQDILDDSDARQNLVNGALWDRSAALENQFLVPRLQADTTAHLDIFNPDDPSGAVDIQSLQVDWSVSCSNVVQMEISMLTWRLIGGDIDFDPATQVVFKQTFACGQDVGTSSCDAIKTNSIGGQTISPGYPYRFNFRLLVPENTSCIGENVVVTAYDGQNATGNIVDLPTRVQIKATGGYARSKQALTASVPWRAPISGLLNFVLFSDESVTK